MVSLIFTWLCLVSQGFVWIHFISFSATLFYLVSISIWYHWTALQLHKGQGLTQGNEKWLRAKREKGKPPHHDFHSASTLHPHRAHARTNETKRNDFPVGLTPQPPIIVTGWFSEAREKGCYCFTSGCLDLSGGPFPLRVTNTNMLRTQTHT